MNNKDSKDKKLTTIQIVGIVIGTISITVVLLILVALFVRWITSKSKHSNRPVITLGHATINQSERCQELKELVQRIKNDMYEFRIQHPKTFIELSNYQELIDELNNAYNEMSNINCKH
jgi:MFS superfamily sulfate permease-like transporter